MHDIRWIREHFVAFDNGLATRGFAPLSKAILALDESHRQAVSDMQTLQAERNSLAKEIGHAKSSGQDARAVVERRTHRLDLVSSPSSFCGRAQRLTVALGSPVSGSETGFS